MELCCVVCIASCLPLFFVILSFPYFSSCNNENRQFQLSVHIDILLSVLCTFVRVKGGRVGKRLKLTKKIKRHIHLFQSSSRVCSDDI
jgi:hypothetical protein